MTDKGTLKLEVANKRMIMKESGRPTNSCYRTSTTYSNHLLERLNEIRLTATELDCANGLCDVVIRCAGNSVDPMVLPASSIFTRRTTDSGDPSPFRKISSASAPISPVSPTKIGFAGDSPPILLSQTSRTSSNDQISLPKNHHQKLQTSTSDNRRIEEDEEAEEKAADTRRKFYAHKVVLAAASPYFNAMFCGGLAETKLKRVELYSIRDEATLASLLEFIYTGKLHITRDNVQSIIIAADMIELEEAVELCTSFLIEELDASNSLGIYRFANDHNCKSLETASRKYIFEHFVEVVRQEEFSELPYENVIEILMNENLRVDSEHQVFVAAMSWLEADIAKRRCRVFEVLKAVRLPLVPSKLIEAFANRDCKDASLKVALASVRADMTRRRGGLVALSAAPRAGAKKSVFVIGGSQRELGAAWTRNECTYSTVEVYDTFEGKWRQVAPPMKVGRILPGIAVMNGLIYVCGGELGSQILASGEIYNPADNIWTEMSSMTVPRCEFGMCTVGGYIYALGGWIGEDIGDSIERYDPNTNQWELIAKMPEPRFSMGIVSYQGLVYLVGGCTHSRRHMQELVSFNPATEEWTTHASMLVSRSQMGCVVLNDHLYVIGGTNRHNEVLQSVERYSFAQDKWESIPAMIEARASPSVGAANGKIYVFGGDQINEVNFYRARTTVAAAEAYDPIANSWSPCAPLPATRSEAAAVVI